MAGRSEEQTWSASRIVVLLDFIQSAMLFLAGVFFGVGVLWTVSGLSVAAVEAFTGSAGVLLFSLTLRAEARSRRGEGTGRAVTVCGAMTVLVVAIYVGMNLLLPAR